jgi:hypothetical protein
MRGDYVTSHFEALWRRQASTVHGHGVCKLCLCRAGGRLQRARPNDRDAWPPAPAVQCMVYCAVRYDLARFVTFNRFECSVAHRQHRGLTNKVDFFT